MCCITKEEVEIEAGVGGTHNVYNGLQVGLQLHSFIRARELGPRIRMAVDPSTSTRS